MPPVRAVMAVLVVVAVSACGNAVESQSQGPAGATPSPSPSRCVLDAEWAGQQCGLSESELRSLNLRYADRMPFTGDAQRLARTVAVVRKALAGVRQPSDPQIRTALMNAGFAAQYIVTSNNAVRTAGLAYAVQLPDGCVFGSFYDGRFSVESGGWVRDGGCLASYGH